MDKICWCCQRPIDDPVYIEGRQIPSCGACWDTMTAVQRFQVGKLFVAGPVERAAEAFRDLMLRHINQDDTPNFFRRG